MDESFLTQKIEKILVIMLAGLGDLVMSSPALRALRKRFPQAEISLLIFKQNEEMGRNCPYVNKVFVFTRGFLPQNLINNFKTLINLRKNNFDLAINLYTVYSLFGTIKMMALFAIANPKTSLGRNTDGKGFFYDQKVKDSMQDNRHQVQCILDTVRVLGIDFPEEKLEVWFDKEKEIKDERWNVF